MSIPGYEACRNITLLGGGSLLGYLLGDDRTDDACAFCHPPAVPSRKTDHQEMPIEGIIPLNQRLPSPTPKCRRHDPRTASTARGYFLPPKLRSHFLEHFNEIPDTAGLHIEGVLPDINAERKANASMITGSSHQLGRFVV
jgi:hypothetical protein